MKCSQAWGPFFAAPCSVFANLHCFCTHYHFGCLYPPFLTQQMSSSPSVCFTYAISFFKYHPILQLKTIFTFCCFLPCEDSGRCHVLPSLQLFVPPLYICYSLHPCIWIQLTQTFLIRVSQRKIINRSLLFFPPSPLPLHMPTPSSRSACSFLSPPCHSNQPDHRKMVLTN